MASKILIVDDSRMTRSVLRKVVSDLGFTPLESSTGTNAIETVEAEAAEIVFVLLDWNIPGVDGLGVLQWIKENESFKHIPVLMVTAVGQPDKVKKAILHGATDYITKPFKPDDVARRLREFCRNKGFKPDND